MCNPASHHCLVSSVFHIQISINEVNGLSKKKLLIFPASLQDALYRDKCCKEKSSRAESKPTCSYQIAQNTKADCYQSVLESAVKSIWIGNFHVTTGRPRKLLQLTSFSYKRQLQQCCLGTAVQPSSTCLAPVVKPAQSYSSPFLQYSGSGLWSRLTADLYDFMFLILFVEQSYFNLGMAL